MGQIFKQMYLAQKNHSLSNFNKNMRTKYSTQMMQ